ncbi:MAG: outer membrane lipoprotein carrier protein LolA [Alphaproteobacteria bacterium]|nr:outer membrane lipoprotein carrier protein LolA [Alphaproteobacteria bacterium]
MKKLASFMFVLALLVPLGASGAPSAAGTATPTHLTPGAANDLHRIETYLNGLHNIEADFIQVDDSGGMLRGKIDISRPGKMRVTYAPPDKDFIIADGDFVHIWNSDLKAQTNVPQDSSLAEFILRDPIKLDSGDVTVTGMRHSPTLIAITLEQTKDPAAGSLTLIFEDHPLMLRQWRVTDAEGRTTGVTLQNVSTGVAFPPNTFFFVPPTFENNP